MTGIYTLPLSAMLLNLCIEILAAGIFPHAILLPSQLPAHYARKIKL
jgi:hypothetical protein